MSHRLSFLSFPLFSAANEFIMCLSKPFVNFLANVCISRYEKVHHQSIAVFL